MPKYLLHMPPDQEHPFEVAFRAARDLPPLERAAFLERACGGNAELRRQADSLLAAHEQGGHCPRAMSD